VHHRPVPISRRTLLRIATLTPLLAATTQSAVARRHPTAMVGAAPPSRHVHRTIIGVI
jgi:hypothetical protein